MNDPTNEDRAFELVSEDGRVIRSARMLREDQKLKPNQRDDIAARFKTFIDQQGCTQKAAARELDVSDSVVSEVLRKRDAARMASKVFVRINNWMELTAQRDTIVRSKEFVETSVAQDILSVALIVAETCKIGVIFGPAQIGKSCTLRAIEGEQRFGAPVLIRVMQFNLQPTALLKTLCEKFELSSNGTGDRLFARLVHRLVGTHRMLIFDEAERLHYRSLEAIRDLHDQTDCPVLFAGKPKIYERLGFRDMGEFKEVTDQISGRISIVRDLTARARGEHPEPLFSLDDIRKLIHRGGLRLDVSPDALRWLQTRASTLSLGGIGKVLVSLYLACRLASRKGDSVITVDHLEAVDALAMGHEDAERVADVVREASGMKRVV